MFSLTRPDWIGEHFPAEVTATDSIATRLKSDRSIDGSSGSPMTSPPDRPEPFLHDDELRHRLTRNLVLHPRLDVPINGRRHASVAIVVSDSPAEPDADDPAELDDPPMRGVPGDVAGLTDKMNNVSGGAAFLLCRRASRMNSHARQWALPGGRVDAGETVEETARRELAEELGLELPTSSVIGRLDDFATRSGYVMSAVVLWADGQTVLAPNPAEVANVYRVGLHELCRADSPRFVTIPESDRPVIQIPLGGSLIHAPTGAILHQFRRVALDGHHGERVDHYEQPIFAWK